MFVNSIMSLFTYRSNQELLWKIINQNEKITRCFQGNADKQNWFRDIIGYFDNNYPNIQTVNELKNINASVLQFMAQDIKTKNQETIQNEVAAPQEFSYEDREREYRKLLEKPQPQSVPNFTEELSNTSITSSDIEQIETQRNQDIAPTNNPLATEIVELRSQMDTRQKEMQEEIKGLRTQLHTCLEFIKSYQDNQNNVQNVQEVLSDLQIAEPKIVSDESNSEVQSIVEDIVISVEGSNNN